MKKILMISYYYPPLEDVGSLRALGFSIHLHGFGWEPYILSVKNPDKSFCRVGNEPPPNELRTFYCRSLFNLNKISWKANGVIRIFLKVFGIPLKGNVVHDLFCIPDIFMGWIIPCYFKSLQLIKENNTDVIYVSCKPFSSAIAGVMLKKKTKKPLILDFRDPVSFPSYLFSNNCVGRFRKRVIRCLEKWSIEQSDVLITTTDETKKRYEQLYPSLNSKVERIYNGYFLSRAPDLRSAKFNKFTIAYLGNFYYDLIPSDIFFQALKKIVEQKIIPSDKIQFLYIGSLRKKGNWLEKVNKKYKLEKNISAMGYVPRSETQTIISKCAMLLLRIASPMISTKLFEGLRDGIPLLAIINKGEVEQLIKKYSKKSYVVTSNKVDDVVAAITDAYENWEMGKLTKSTNQEFLNRFNKNSLTKELVKILDDVTLN